MKTYLAYDIQDNSEILVGLLSQFPFESFEEKEDHMIAYIPEDAHDAEVAMAIATVLDDRQVAHAVTEIKPQNWNAIWESNFEPVRVDDFCEVRADFHPASEGILHDIIINPKMAFGTGHHETTYMMMSAMRNLDMKDKIVFDYGCGTGVLAILSSKLGAKEIDAIDIEEESYDNTLENAKINHVENIHAACAVLDTFAPRSYDIILANINRKVLLDSVTELHNRLCNDGALLLSGILDVDVELVTSRYLAGGFTLEESYARGYWRCLLMKK